LVFIHRSHADRFLNVGHRHFHSLYEKLLSKGQTNTKDGTECIYKYFPCRKKGSDCKLKHVMNWLSLFADMHNREITGKIVNEQSR
jgi:hypothetical protein